MSSTKPPLALPPSSLHTTEDLQFDRDNPRLAEYGISKKASDEDIIKILWEEMDVRELILSISTSGFFQHEQLIVAKEDRKTVVIEGNRRLAAVKLLLRPEIGNDHGWNIPVLDTARRKNLEQLPVLYSTRLDAWRYLAFKHVNGPAKWSSYAKAKYITDVHRQYEIPLVQIAEQIGDQHQIVPRLYRGLMVMEQAEKAKVYNRENRFRQRFAFSHLYTGLDGDGISTFLGLKSDDMESTTPVPKSKLKELGELCDWLYGSKKDNRPPVVEKQAPQLWQLNDVLKNREALASLRSDRDLSSALEISRDTREVFEEALLKAKRELVRARAHSTEGYDNSEDLLRIAGSVAMLAEDIYEEMERKRTPPKKQRLTE